MDKTIKVALAGAGAFGIKHLDGITNIDGVEVVSLVSRDLDKTREVADKYGIGHIATDLADSLALPEVDAVILCTPTEMHADQSIQCLKAGKHVQVEIPLADTLKGADEVARMQKETGLVAMVGHTRRFNPSHQWVHNKIRSGEFNIQQMDVQTYFFRRTNMNALGQPRSWTDIELQDREFFAAIREGREPNASVAQVLPCYRVLHQLEQQLEAAGV